MRANGDILAECWGKRDLHALRFYLTVDVASFMGEGETDRSLTDSILNETHVATVPGSDFGLPGTIRLSYSASQFENAIDRLAAYFEGKWI
jgi:aspartate/methionine/tyrosine aminotransferase